MSTPFLIVTRFSELVLTGNIDSASAYLDDDVILQSWQGVIEGKMDVVNYLNDSRRFMHHKRSFKPWRRVLRSMEREAEGTSFDRNNRGDGVSEEGGSVTHRLVATSSSSSGFPPGIQVADAEDFYDGQGYVIYERLGTMSTRPRFSVKKVQVRESIAIRNNLIVLILLSKQGFL